MAFSYHWYNFPRINTQSLKESSWYILLNSFLLEYRLCHFWPNVCLIPMLIGLPVLKQCDYHSKMASPDPTIVSLHCIFSATKCSLYSEPDVFTPACYCKCTLTKIFNQSGESLLEVLHRKVLEIVSLSHGLWMFMQWHLH